MGFTPSVSHAEFHSQGIFQSLVGTGSFCLRVSSGFAKSQTCTFGVPHTRGISSLLSVNLYLDSTDLVNQSQEDKNP